MNANYPRSSPSPARVLERERFYGAAARGRGHEESGHPRPPDQSQTSGTHEPETNRAINSSHGRIELTASSEIA